MTDYYFLQPVPPTGEEEAQLVAGVEGVHVGRASLAQVAAAPTSK